MNEYETKEAQDNKKYCFCCEKRKGGWFQLAEEGDVKLAICFECFGIGIRWIVKKGREDMEKLEASH